MGPDFVIDLEFYYTQTEDPVKKKDKKKVISALCSSCSCQFQSGVHYISF